MFTLLVVSFTLTLSILISTTASAIMEVMIEGPFGWSTTTFTSHPKGLVRKVFQLFAGRDKTVTTYHLVVPVIWLMLSMGSLPFLLFYGELMGVHVTSAIFVVLCLALSSWIITMNTEDWLWFQIHPWYGPARHNKRYVYWFQNFKAGLPITYWTSVTSTFVIMAAAAFLAHRWEIILMWFITVALIVCVCFGIIQPLAAKAKRNPLQEFWWRKIEALIVIPYPPEFEIKPGEIINDRERFLVISNEVVNQLVKTGQVLPLDQVLSGEKEK